MKKIVFLAIASASFFPALVSADTTNFEGFSAGGSLNMVSAGLKVSDEFNGGATFDGYGGKQSHSLTLDAGYGLKISPKMVLTFGIDMDLTKPTFFRITEGTDSISLKQKNRYGLYLAPGFAINRDTLVYVRLGYTKAKLEFPEFGFEESGFDEKFSGVSCGVGSRIMLSDSLFMKIEASRQTYSSKSYVEELVSFKPSATVGMIGIGMRF